MWSRVQDVVSSSLDVIQFLYFTVSAGVWDNQLFPLPQPLCLPEGIYSPFSAVLYNFCKWYPWENRQIVCATTETNSLCLGLPQANSSLFEPAAALVYLSRQHQKSDSYHRCAWFEWKSGALVMHGKVKICSLFAALNRSKSIYPSENAEETKFEETSFRIGAVCICLYSVQVFFLLFFFFFYSF